MSERQMTECPPPRIWDEIATGLLKGEAAMAHLEHASRCEACARLLEESLEVFGPDVDGADADPAKGIALVPATPARPALVTPAKPLLAPSWRWATAAAVLMAAVAGGVYLWRPADPLVQLAQVYGRERTAEVRVVGAPHSDWRPARAGTASSGERSVEWLKAAAAIRAGLDANPRDPRILQAQGRLALMENRLEEAIAAFRQARDLGATDAGTSDDELTIDLASAYYQRGLTRGDAGASDLTLGQELLGPVLLRSPDHPVALFNRSLMSAELHQLPQAIADLERVLRVEQDAAWRKEASERLEKLRSRLRGFLERDPGDDERRLVEVALDRVLRDPRADWAPVAKRLAEEHGDPWLMELTALRRTPAMQDALTRLAGLAEIRLTAQRGRYQTDRQAAAPLETAALDPPLAAWRDFELAYRSTHSGGAFSCLVARVPVRYRWLWVQAQREAGSCAFQSGNVAGRRRLTEESRDAARAADFKASAVRSDALLAGEEYLKGRYRESLARQRVLLGRIMADRLPLARAPETIHLMLLSTRALGRHHAARSAALLAASIAHRAGLRNPEFTNRVYAAELALRTGDRDGAVDQYRQAVALYNESHEEAAAPITRAWAEVILAEATGDESRLAPYVALLERTQVFSAQVPYLRVRAQWDGPVQAERRLQELWALLKRKRAEDPPGLWREEVALAANRLIDLQLAQGRTAEALGLVQELLAWNTGGGRMTSGVGPARRGQPAPTVFSLRQLGARVGVWKRDAQGNVSFRLAGSDSAKIELAIRRLRRYASSRSTSVAEIGDAAGALTAALFGSWLAELPNDGLIVFQAEGILSAIPYSLLRGGRTDLGREQRIAHTNGPIATGAEAAPRSFALSRQALLVDATRAPGLAERGLAPLPPPEEEWSALRRYAAPAVVLRAPDAAGLRRAMKGVGLLHYAGHAQVSPLETGLVLGRETMGEVGGEVPPRVVLSACSTSRPYQEEEDTVGPVSLAETFLRAGASEVIAADWDLDNRAAAALMGVFYEELARSEDMGVALREAVRRLAERPEFEHPYFWAGVRWVITT